MSRWAKPQHSRGSVDRAGRTLVTREGPNEEFIDALTVINNWRSSHSYPLTIIKNTLRSRAKKVNEKAITAQRLKRLSSITVKLLRNPNMKLSQMQDIGGCRVVLDSVEEVEQLAKIYDIAQAKNPQGRSERIEKYDYIINPKPDGYRSMHFVYKYWSKAPPKDIYNGLRVEIQIRSQLQHVWATSVETVSTFTDQALKTGMGSDEWKRFFALMGSAMALREGRPLVPNTPSDRETLVEELKALYTNLQVENVLLGMTDALKKVGEEAIEAAVYLLVLDSSEKSLEIITFDKTELQQASEQYLLVEQENANNPNVQAVLVSVDSVTNLQNAYPNYYLDTTQFVLEARDILGSLPPRFLSEVTTA